MTKDIVPELLEKIKDDFFEVLKKDKEIQRLTKLLESGNVTHKQAHEYSVRIGKLLSEQLIKHLTVDNLPDGRAYYNIAERILNETLSEDYKLVTNYSSAIQEILNKDAGLGLKARVPGINQSRIDGLVERLSEDVIGEMNWVLAEPIVNFSNSIVDDFVDVNFEFHGKLGLKPKITRSVVAKCCDWCEQKAGTYDYPAPREIYMRHRNCNCIVEYHPGDGRIQNTHTRKWR